LACRKSGNIRERVIKARDIQVQRFGNRPNLHANAQMSPQMVRDLCKIDAAGQTLLKKAMEKLGLSATAYDRILKVARTIGDLAGGEEIKLEHLEEAINCRSLDREGSDFGSGGLIMWLVDSLFAGSKLHPMKIKPAHISTNPNLVNACF
jgi:magnesium chelatase family protein